MLVYIPLFDDFVASLLRLHYHYWLSILRLFHGSLKKSMSLSFMNIVWLCKSERMSEINFSISQLNPIDWTSTQFSTLDVRVYIRRISTWRYFSPKWKKERKREECVSINYCHTLASLVWFFVRLIWINTSTTFIKIFSAHDSLLVNFIAGHSSSNCPTFRRWNNGSDVILTRKIFYIKNTQKER